MGWLRKSLQRFRGLPQQEVAIRGRAEPMIVRSVTDAKTLTALVDDVDVAAA
jgi:adenylate cyclase